MPKVLYWPVNGRACMIRMLLKHAGVTFADEHPGQDGNKPWPELKAEFPERGGLPWYTDDSGKTYS